MTSEEILIACLLLFTIVGGVVLISWLSTGSLTAGERTRKIVREELERARSLQ